MRRYIHYSVKMVVCVMNSCQEQAVIFSMTITMMQLPLSADWFYVVSSCHVDCCYFRCF